MTLMEALYGKIDAGGDVALKSRTARTSYSASSASFKSVFDIAGKANDNSASAAATQNPKPDYPQTKAPADKTADNKPVKSADYAKTNDVKQSASADKNAAPDKADKTVKTDGKPPAQVKDGAGKPIKTDAADKKNTAEKKIIGDVAKALNISEDDVRQILASLNMSALDLTKADNMNLFAQKLYNVGTSADLLAVNGIRDVFAALTEAVGSANALNAETAQNQPQTADSTAQTLNAANAADESMASMESMKTADAAPVVEIVNSAGTAKLDPNANENFLQKIADAAKPADNAGAVNAAAKQAAAAGMQAEKVVAQVENQTQPNGQAAQPQTKADAQAQTPVNMNAIIDADKQIAGRAGNDDHEMTPVNAAVMTAAKSDQNEAVRAEAIKNVDVRDIIDQIVEKMKVEIKGDATAEIRISLKPENLGDVSLKIATQNGIVTAQFTAENQRVKEALEAGFNNLKDALQEQGVAISELNVTVGDSGQQAALTGSGESGGLYGLPGAAAGANAETQSEQAADEYYTPEGTTIDYRI